MKLSLAELLAQKKLIETHLDWLNQQIKELQDETGASSHLLESPGKTSAPSPDTPLPQIPTPQFAGAKPELDLKQNDATEPGPPTIDLPTSDVQTQARNTKIGCIAMGLLLGAMILFLLFGLPFLIY